MNHHTDTENVPGLSVSIFRRYGVVLLTALVVVFSASAQYGLRVAPKVEMAIVPAVGISRLGQPYLPKAAIKTNLLYLATTTLNTSVELGLGHRWTVDLAAGYNPFRLRKTGTNQLWFVQPEFRYWFCQRFERHFIGLHGIYGEYNIGHVDLLTTTFVNHRYKGRGVGAGVSYGYHLPMGKRWAWEFTVGGGYVWLDYDKYVCYECDELLENKGRHYFGPTKATVSLVFMIK